MGVLVDVPLPGVFDYRWNFVEPPRQGESVVVPWGNRPVWAWVWEVRQTPAEGLDISRIRDVQARIEVAPLLDQRWRALMDFASRYYQHPAGACVADALPRIMKHLSKDAAALPALRKWAASRSKVAGSATDNVKAADALAGGSPEPSLNLDQATAVATLSALEGFSVHLLYGVTGSGKTEVYLRVIRDRIRAGLQCLLLLPEINLTPQIEQYLSARLPGVRMCTLHSGLADGERARRWLAAQAGETDLVIATRLGVFTPLPRLGLVLVDEEHDASYKQMEGLKYSARDLAVVLGRLQGVPVVLGSATPSLETWHRVQTGQYALLRLPQRAVQGAELPSVEVIDTRHHRLEAGIAAPAIDAIRETLAGGFQALVFLNRRGYAPTLMCESCGWVAGCPACSAHAVWHRSERRLRCHLCGHTAHMPSRCPTCGNQDLSAFGRGTQRIEETLQALFPDKRLLRIDADSTRGKDGAQLAFEAAHGDGADILVGTQMVAKGHDFKRVKLVLALNVDTSLFSHQPKAAERLFAQLMQVSGRAGRSGGRGRFLVQTGYPHHPVFDCLKRQDFEAFARHELQLREEARMPPFMFHALLRADHRKLDTAMAFLREARALGMECLDRLQPDPNHFIHLCDPVPLTVVRVARVERAQLLIESSSRSLLQSLLSDWLGRLSATRGSVRWFVDVDPTEI